MAKRWLMSDFGGRADIKIRGRILKTGGMVTVCCAEGEIGRVYEGALPIKTTHVELNEVKRPRTEIMLNLGNPELAFRTAMLPNDGISERKLGAHRVGPV